MKKVIGFLQCLLPLVAALAAQLAGSVVFLIGTLAFYTVVGKQKGISGEQEAMEFFAEKTSTANYALLSVCFATFCVLVLGYFWFKKYNTKEDLTIKNVVNIKVFPALAAMGIGLQIAVSYFLSIVMSMIPQKVANEYDALMTTLTDGSIWFSLLATVVLAPLAEEFIFRGVVMRKAKTVMAFWIANCLQAVLFGIYHLNLLQGIYAFALGLVLGYTAEHFNSIWAAVLLHAFINGAGELLQLIPASILGTLPGMIAIIVVGTALITYAVCVYKKVGKFTENSFDE